MANFNGTIDTIKAVAIIPSAPLYSAQAQQPLTAVHGHALAEVAVTHAKQGALSNPVEAVYAMAFGASVHEQFGAELFEKIIVTPRIKALGFVLATQQWNTDVWNTHRNRLATLTGVTIPDAGSVHINNPYTLPLIFGPGQAHDFLTIVPGEGDATISALATFDFIGESGTDMRVTGVRIAVFTPDADWTDPISERTEYLTDVLTGYGENEQRIQLRKHPRTRLKYKILTTSARETAALDSLLFGWQGRQFAVPLWADAQPLLVRTIGSETLTLSVDTSNRRFVAGGMVALWRSMFANEAATVLSVSAGSVTVTSPINGSFAADGRTLVIPCLLGRMPNPLKLARLTSLNAQGAVEFECEVI